MKYGNIVLALLPLAACKPDKVELPELPPMSDYRLEYMAASFESDPAWKDTTFYLYNTDGSLDRITRYPVSQHNDTTKYHTGFVYQGGKLVAVKHRPVDALTILVEMAYSGNKIKSDWYSLNAPNPEIPRATFAYFDAQGKLTHSGDTTIAAQRGYYAFIWDGANLVEIRRRLWMNNKHETDLITRFTYEGNPKNPYFHSGISQAIHASTGFEVRSFNLCNNLIRKEELYDGQMMPISSTEFTWEFDEKGLPVICRELYKDHSRPNSGSTLVRKFHYRKK